MTASNPKVATNSLNNCGKPERSWVDTMNTGTGDPSEYLAGIYKTGALSNYAGYTNSELDALADTQGREADPAKRKEMVQKAEQILMKDLPAIPFFYFNRGTAWHAYVKNFNKFPHPNGNRLDQVWMTAH